MIRPAIRTSVRAARTFATEAGAANDFVAQRAAVKAHAKDTTALWRNISFFACIPTIIGGSFWAYKLEADHHHHLEHLKHENGGQLPHPPAYEYLNIRTKPFPWGMQSLFFNPEVNQEVEAA
ncbi:Cytochrome c oxidase subunit 6A [Vanrija albida]|uniref:Cytochrome c oxidase subunit 6A n=1 Tax=Vanrija albida TaxID=181172 RepID=A0ABR3PV18_9TREE